MDKQTKLLAELLSASELMVIDQFMQLMVKNNTFERRLEKRTQNIELLNAKIVALEKKENIYHLEIQKLKQNSIDTAKTAKITNTTVPQVVIKKKIIDGAMIAKKLKSDVELVKRPNSSINKTISSNNELEQGVWTDPKTGLMWARISIGQEWNNGQCIGDAKFMNWTTAQIACRHFRLADCNDWRLPTIDELETLMKKAVSGYTCPNNTLFQPKNRIDGSYWSITECDFHHHFAWIVYFGGGSAGSYSKTNDYYVRAVRTT
ncbi:DUF1566 domain-containing protein [Acinetobacter beijerinckii]|uniref:Lcl C-terminal domain-containing protein n=2 Tax=Acinetobacter TaxID=469 RepID=R9B2W4_9GAMM|nr:MULTISPECIES: DUF1566 domain-containing protein [Acinetobacter]EOR08829.1 hypothetical protein F896_01359 [Acinetobacter genomosp. 15BJ]ESK53546.1 hypothetical protein F990_03326 [Acinetobacter tjernbergiae DSM 14971 = CIP 107465]